jgi:hypothetical protein
MCRASANVKEATELIAVEHEYACGMNSIKPFRKRK